jgi:homoserine dehydrogenase
VLVEGDLVNRVLFFGEGAGALPTGSAVVADIIAIARNITSGYAGNNIWLKLDPAKRIRPMDEVETRYYLRMSIADRAGVLAQIARVLGDNEISISSAIQLEADIAAQAAEIVIMTHPALEKSLQVAIRELDKLDVVREISNFIRVEII